MNDYGAHTHDLPLTSSWEARIVTVSSHFTIIVCYWNFSCLMWTSYGILKDPALIPVNVIGMLTQVAYMLCFFLYCKNKVFVHVQCSDLISLNMTLHFIEIVK